MSWTRVRATAGSIARVARAEGFAAVRDRLWDRARDAAARARCVTGGTAPWPAAAILNVIGVPMKTAFGGVPLQLRARLRRESLLRPVALLSREAGGGAAPPAAATPGPAGAAGPASVVAVAAGRSVGFSAAAAGATRHREGGMPGAGWRLEAWSGGRPRRAVTFPAGDWDGNALNEDPAWLHAVRTSATLVNARAIHIENADGLSLVSLSALISPTALDGRASMDGASMGGASTADASIDSESSSGASAAGASTGGSTGGPRPRAVLSVHDLSLFSNHPHLPHLQQAPVTRGAANSHEPPVDDRQRFEHALHHALGTGILRAAVFAIYPSQFMRHRIEALPHLPAHVIAPGIEPPARAARSARRHDQIAILGGGQEHKGGARLARIAAALAARGMHVTTYGGYGHEHLLPLRGISGVRVRGYYRAGSLPELLVRQGASVALILSAVPESFSLVLSEAWAAGVPVVAPASGAFIERLRAPDAPAAAHASAVRASAAQHHHTGTPSDEDAVGAGGLLISAAASDEAIVDAVDRARRLPWDTLPAPPTAAQAADLHLALYRNAGFIATEPDS